MSLLWDTNMERLLGGFSEVEIIAPTGQNLGRISGFSRINRMQLNNNLVLSILWRAFSI